LRIDEPAAFLFVTGLVLMLLAQTPAMVATWPWLAGLRHGLLSWLVAPVLRGVLIGLSLGVVWRLLAHLGGRSG
jgi:ACR3 family arsenite efflux pump ArsB